MKPDLSLFLFGSPRLEYCGVSVNIPRTGSQAILYYLAHISTPVSRQRIAGFIWPDHSEKSARRQLSYSIYHLNKILSSYSIYNIIELYLFDNLIINSENTDHIWDIKMGYQNLSPFYHTNLFGLAMVRYCLVKKLDKFGFIEVLDKQY